MCTPCGHNSSGQNTARLLLPLKWVCPVMSHHCNCTVPNKKLYADIMSILAESWSRCSAMIKSVWAVHLHFYAVEPNHKTLGSPLEQLACDDFCHTSDWELLICLGQCGMQICCSGDSGVLFLLLTHSNTFVMHAAKHTCLFVSHTT